MPRPSSILGTIMRKRSNTDLTAEMKSKTLPSMNTSPSGSLSSVNSDNTNIDILKFCVKIK